MKKSDQCILTVQYLSIINLWVLCDFLFYFIFVNKMYVQLQMLIFTVNNNHYPLFSALLQSDKKWCPFLWLQIVAFRVSSFETKRSYTNTSIYISIIDYLSISLLGCYWQSVIFLSQRQNVIISSLVAKWVY